MNTIKKELRAHARRHRDQMNVDESNFEAVVDTFMEEVSPSNDEILALYWPYGKEFDCRFLLDELVSKGFKCALPIIEKQSRVMKFREWSHTTKMIKGLFNILEPETGEIMKPDIVIAPLLAFDQKGYRLGQGGGYYDATITFLKKEKPVDFIGIGFAEQAVLLKLPREAHDIPLDAMLTPQKLIRF